ncbi:unnamed protein product [Cladocopium goreaui]|uniref:Uncharacterized protein n=1 Tax=Cladocopium goreaui TaxID=2562237 RepID=A0A9P1DNM7_9DINO|nr:unnamed protein product [Cladocopium goreaui]
MTSLWSATMKRKSTPPTAYQTSARLQLRHLACSCTPCTTMRQGSPSTLSRNIVVCCRTIRKTRNLQARSGQAIRSTRFPKLLFACCAVPLPGHVRKGRHANLRAAGT